MNEEILCIIDGDPVLKTNNLKNIFKNMNPDKYGNKEVFLDYLTGKDNNYWKTIGIQADLRNWNLKTDFKDSNKVNIYERWIR